MDIFVVLLHGDGACDGDGDSDDNGDGDGECDGDGEGDIDGPGGGYVLFCSAELYRRRLNM